MESQHVAKLEGQIGELRSSLAGLAKTTDLEELIVIIRRPGWTTPAELTFASGIVDSMLAHTKVLTGLRQVLMSGSQRVTVGR